MANGLIRRSNSRFIRQIFTKKKKIKKISVKISVFKKTLSLMHILFFNAPNHPSQSHKIDMPTTVPT